MPAFDRRLFLKVLHQIITRFRSSASTGILLTVYRRMPLGLIAGL